METTYFLDTYALIEIIRKNENFKKFKETINFTSHVNLLEMHYSLSKELDITLLNEIVDDLKTLVVQIETKDVKEASVFRKKHSNKEFSYIDCLGYSMALNRNIIFVTGDSGFKGMENVEFIK